eukprot:g16148.t1
MRAAQDWDTVSKSMVGMLEQEARERALNQDAIATLRRRSMRTPSISSASNGNATAPGVPTKSASRASGQGVPSVNHLAKRPERRVRRLRSLPGASLRQGPPDALPLRRRRTGGNAGGSSGTGGGGGPDAKIDDGRITDTPATNGTHPPSSSSSRGAGGGASADSDQDTSKAETGEVAAALWPSRGREGWGRRRRPSVPPGVTMTDTIPARLSCGYCRKFFRAEILGRHEDRAVPDKPLFALFKKSRGDRDRGRDATKLEEVTASPFSSTKRAAGFLGGWTAGEGLRRPVPLVNEEGTRSGLHGPYGIGGDHDDGEDGGGDASVGEETAEERWIREPCGGDPDEGGHAGGRERGAGQDGDGLFVGESDESFMLREREQMRSHLEKVRDAAKVRRYTEKWFRFATDPPEKIRHCDVPWLPRLSALEGTGKLYAAGGCGVGAKGGLQRERFETLGVNEGDSSDLKKAAIRAASLRWHPDKFMSKYGPRIVPEDRSKIAKDVQATMHRITKLRERLHHQAEVDAAGTPSPPGVGS